MAKPRLLVVDDDHTLRTLLAGELANRGFDVEAAGRCDAAIAKLEGGDYDVALVDLRLPDGDGIDILSWCREHRPNVEVIMLTGHGSIDTAIEAMRAGASDYLRKPCPTDELEVSLHKALEHSRLVEQASILTDGLAPPDLGDEFVGASSAFEELARLIDRVATTDASVLILGETGVGKDVIAKLLHARSPRSRKPQVVVECAALHEELLHSELFGHEKGAYTGATQAKHGLFEVANGGTIFLDEIGDVSPATQVKLLRVLETGRFRHVGGTKEVEVDVRVVAATNRDLEDLMEKGRFRRDLFFRLSTIRIEVPPLRERRADVPVLIDHFLARMGERMGSRCRLSAEALTRMEQHAWPGNVRELKHALERAVILADGEVVEVEQLPPELTAVEHAGSDELISLRDLERRHIASVLEAMGGNRNRAAAVLEISERTLYRKLKEYGLV